MQATLQKRVDHSDPLREILIFGVKLDDGNWVVEETDYPKLPRDLQAAVATLLESVADRLIGIRNAPGDKQHTTLR